MTKEKKSAETCTTRFEGFRDRGICMNIRLDKRTSRKDVKEFPVVARFTEGKSSFYYPIGGTMSEFQFAQVCIAKMPGTAEYDTKKQWCAVRDKLKAHVECIHTGGFLTLKMVEKAIKDGFVTNSKGETNSFMSLWREMTDKYLHSDKYSTGEFYLKAYRSFDLIVGADNIIGFDIGINDLKTWKEGMENGVYKKVHVEYTKVLSGKHKGEIRDRIILDEKTLKEVKEAIATNKQCPNRAPVERTLKMEKRLVGKNSVTTIGINLRMFRAVWNAALKKGYLHGVEYPFDKTEDDTHIKIPKSNHRKDEFLDVEKMTTLYNIFINKDYPDTWTERKKKSVHYALGLFLAQYLCNGFNLADAALLQYTKYYFNTDGKAFCFNRKKTSERSDDGSEVIVPVIDSLKKILEEIAAVPTLDGYVFPNILKGKTDPVSLRKLVAQENANIRRLLYCVTHEILGWDARITNTWARHSFATNLRNAGVDMQYISDAMGHSTQKSVTQIYMGSYPLDKQFEYNRKLLTVEPEFKQPASGKSSDPNDVDSMNAEQLRELVKKMALKMAMLG